MAETRLPSRRSIRLPAYDYAGAGGFFITLVTHQRQCLFGEIIGLAMRLNELAEIVQHEWLRSAEMRSGIVLDTFVVMPNHVHGIVIVPQEPVIDDDPGKTERRRQSSGSLGSLVAGFKAAVTRRNNTLRQPAGQQVWQRNYYEHVIRNDTDLDRIREYIENNPARWEEDSENPQRRGAR